MSLELIYTSAAKGLKPGSRGFCTVAMTQGMPPQLVDRLEALSGYRQVFAPQDPQAGLNPVVCSHLRISVAGRNYHVLSRVCAAGLDYSQRTNKFAHHVVLDANELPPAGPAWLLAMPGFMTTAWDQTTRLLPPRPRPPAGNSAPAVCQRWQQATGDAGWGGVLIDAAIKNPRSMATLIFRPGQDPLPLLAESLALLPVELRWQATFSTYYTRLPPGVECRWRCVVEGSPEAKTAAGLVINLCHRLAQPPAGEYVTAARTGRVPTAKGPPRLIPADAPDDSELAHLLGDPIAPPISAPVHAPIEATDWPGSLQLPPSLPADMSADSGSTLSRRRFREKESAQWPYVVGLLAIALLMVVAGIAVINLMSSGNGPASKSTAATVVANDPSKNVVQPNRPEDLVAVAKRQADELDAKRKSDAEKAKGAADEAAKQKAAADAAVIAKQKAAEADKEKARIVAANEKMASEERARQLTVDDVDKLGDAISLPARRFSAPHGPVEIGPLRVPKGMRCTFQFFGGKNLSKGFHLLPKQTVRGSSNGLEVSLVSDSSTIPPTAAANFWVKDNKLYFDWESGSGGSPIVEQILNSVLEVWVAQGDKPAYARMLSLRVPVGNSPPINLGKVLSGDAAVESPSQTLPSPPDPVPELSVEFIGAPKTTPTRRPDGDSRFQVGHRIQFDVQPVLSSDGRVILRVKYLGVPVSWKLPKNDPLGAILHAPPDPSRIQVGTLNGIVKHLSQRSDELKGDIKLFSEKPGPKNGDGLEKLIKKLTGATQECLRDMDGSDEKESLSERLKKLSEDLTKLETDCEKYLGEAKSLQHVFVELEGTTCGYRVYFTVHGHKVYLVTSGDNSGTTADTRLSR